MTPEAEQLVADFWQFTADQHWTTPSRDINAKVLRLLVAWLGIDALLEADVRAVTRLGRTGGTTFVAAFLDQRGLLVPWSGPIRSRPRWNGSCRVSRSPAGRGGRLGPRAPGREHPHDELGGHPTLCALQRPGPAAVGPAGSAVSVRSPRRTSRTYSAAAWENKPISLHASLRSLFRALKRERVIFRDPARGVSVASTVRRTPAHPVDRLVGLLDKAPTAMAKVAVALVAIHALGPRRSVIST